MRVLLAALTVVFLPFDSFGAVIVAVDYDTNLPDFSGAFTYEQNQPPVDAEITDHRIRDSFTSFGKVQFADADFSANLNDDWYGFGIFVNEAAMLPTHELSLLRLQMAYNAAGILGATARGHADIEFRYSNTADVTRYRFDLQLDNDPNTAQFFDDTLSNAYIPTFDTFVPLTAANFQFVDRVSIALEGIGVDFGKDAGNMLAMDNISFSAVPEPTNATLLFSCLATFAIIGTRKRRQCLAS